jgi:signal transduction histidine kinase
VRIPPFLAEMAAPQHRARLHMSVKTGYLTTLGFVVLAIVADRLHVLPFHRAFLVPLVAKLVTNTAAWLALRADRGVLPAVSINVSMDAFVLTAIIDFTGGELSPVFPIYLIEMTVVALLGNVGVTVFCAVGSIALYAAMALLLHAGVLHAYPPPVALTGGVTGRYLVVDLAYAGCVIGLPTFYAARILQDLRDKQRALEQRTQALVEAGRQKSQFMANVTHELRTPIHGICGLSDLIESGIYGSVTVKQKDAQQSIKRSARSLLALIDDLLELSRDEAGELSMRPEPVDVGELVTTVVAAARWMIGTKALVVETELAGELPRVETDPRAFKQVLVNLLSNAAKFTPEGGRVVVRAQREGAAAVRVEVQDSGIGIAPQDQERIFEAFRQLDGSAERQYGGVGLGLAVVQRLTQAMRARVDVASERGEGATFAVVVPVAWPRGEAEKAA